MTRILLVVLTLLMPTALAMQVGEDTSGCAAEDTSGGVGGQEVGCKFKCQAESQLTIFVQAVDEDADVSGTARCGGVSAHCAEPQTCTATEGWTSEAGAGTCSASSNEALDSGLYVECASRPGGEPEPLYCLPVVGCIPPPDPGEVDVGDVGAEPDAPVCPAMVKLDPRRVTGCVTQSSRSSAWMWIGNGVAVGEVCTDTCRPVAPTCHVREGRQTCSIGFAFL